MSAEIKLLRTEIASSNAAMTSSSEAWASEKSELLFAISNATKNTNVVQAQLDSVHVSAVNYYDYNLMLVSSAG